MTQEIVALEDENLHFIDPKKRALFQLYLNNPLHHQACEELADWLSSLDIKLSVMESTGILWKKEACVYPLSMLVMSNKFLVARLM